MESGQAWDVLVVGAGAAGLSAAIGSAHSGARTLALDGGTPGGVLASLPFTPDPLLPPGTEGPKLTEDLLAAARTAGVTFGSDRVFNFLFDGFVWIAETNAQPLRSASVVVATGRDVLLPDVPGIELLVGHGISDCAACDAFFFRQKPVAVYGSDALAIADACFLAQRASQVTVLVPHSSGTPNTHRLELPKNIAFKTIRSIAAFSKSEGPYGHERLESLTLEEQDGTFSELLVQGLFLCQPGRARTEAFHAYSDLLLEDASLIADAEGRCPHPGLYAAGSVCRSQEQTYHQVLAESFATGCRAAISALERAR